MRGGKFAGRGARHCDELGRTTEVAEDPTTVLGTPSSRSPLAPALQLVVLEAGGLTIHPLPSEGSISIGRGADCEVRISDARASRKHAILHLAPLAIEDNGSTNGTKLGGRRLDPNAPAEIQPGHALSIGAALLIVRESQGQPQRSDARAASQSGAIPRTNAIVVQAPVMQSLYGLVDRLAKGQINVLVLGETGVGKEVVAEAIHRASPRAHGPLLRINCAALSEALLESELFGHERGAFTGAIATKAGLVELASGGTVFLDEVGELPLRLQAKLLRLIETREALRVGGLRPRLVDVRFLFATNRNLEQAVAHGEFRADLLFRMKGATVEVPPLRERSSEIIPLAEAFAARAAIQMQLSAPPTLSAPVRERLLAYGWPGNVRELRNVIERAVLLCTGSEIGTDELALESATAGTDSEHARVASEASSTQVPPDAQDAERERVAKALLACGGNQSRAAEWLGMPRRTLVRRIAQFGLPRPRGGG